MQSLMSNLEATAPEAVKAAFAELLKDYLTPAYGAISKREFDIMLFIKLQKLGVIPLNPDLYTLVSELRITRSKARSLLYESKLRQSSALELDLELKVLLANPIFYKDQERVGIEVDNPYLIDYLRSKLKSLHFITDGSFSPELVKMTLEAYTALFKHYMPEATKSEFHEMLVAGGAKSDVTIGEFLKAVLMKFGTKVADEAGSKAAESAVDYLEPLLMGAIGILGGKLSALWAEKP